LLIRETIVNGNDVMPPYELPLWLTVAVLAVVQGVTEFLPISSDGHLVAVSQILETRGATVELIIILHLGTLGSILVYYWRRVIDLLFSDRSVIPLLIIGTLPAVVIGLIIKTRFEYILEDPLLAGFMLPVTGFVLMLLPVTKRGETEYQAMRWWTALLIGIAQAFALLPGISRSGCTIVAGSLLGLKRQSAATFSFLLAIPAILGASVLEFKDILEHGTTSTPWELLLLGAAISFAVGLLSLALLVKWLELGRLHYFAYWVIPLGFLIVVWQLYETTN
jgi:undecaprenyl-diphosphatase